MRLRTGIAATVLVIVGAACGSSSSDSGSPGSGGDAGSGQGGAAGEAGSGGAGGVAGSGGAGGQAGSAGSAGAGGSSGAAGSGGSAGTGGAAGSGGDAGSGGAAGSGGGAGTGGAAGSGGSAGGAGGTADAGDDAAAPSVTLPVACGVTDVQFCNPIDGSGCDVAGGETCDFGIDANSGNPMYACYPPPNTAALDEACDISNGPYCGAGLFCATTGVCVKYCCSDADCGSGTCVNAGQLGDVGACDYSASDAGVDADDASADGAGGDAAVDAAPDASSYAVDGDWQGTTSQGKTITFRVSGGQVTIFWVDWSVSSSGCTDSARTRDYGATAIAANTFTRTSTGSNTTTVGGGGSMTYTLQGTFASGTSASGDVTFDDTTTSSGGCNASSNATWTATRTTPLVYDGSWTGTTSDSKAITFTVSGGDITALSFGFALPGTTCNGSTNTVTWPATVTTPEILGGWAFVSGATAGHIVAPLANLTFTAAKSASGTAHVTYLDTSQSPTCLGNDNPTWTATRP